MTKEERELLLKDLSARLFYNVIVKQYSSINGYVNNDGETIDIPLNKLIHSVFERNFLTIRPYLRPMSSMTKEEKIEYDSFNAPTAHRKVWVNRLDWLLSNHFDFRGLIPMGLALEAPEEMYKVN